MNWRTLATTIATASLLATAVTVGASQPVPVAHAETTTTITFGNLAVGTTISNQYDAQGLDFANGIVDGGVYCYPVVSQVFDNLRFKQTVAGVSCANGEFPDSSAWGVLKNDAQNLSMVVGFYPNWSNPPSSADMILTAYDADGNVVGSDTESVPAKVIGSPSTTLQISSASANIAQFSIANADVVGGCDCPDVVMSSVTFDNPAGIPPDFRLRPEAGEMAVAQGFTNTDVIDVNRLNGSTGNITMSASGLPTGVQASFNPNPATGATTTMTLTAASNTALTSTYPYPNMTITGTPDASSGSTPHSATVAVDVFPPYTISAQNSIQVPPCSQAQIPVRITWNLDPIQFKEPFNGAINLAATGVPPDDQASFNPSTVTPQNGTNSAISTLTLTSQSDISSTSSEMTITGTSGSLSESTPSLSVSRVKPSIVDVHPIGGQTPQGDKGGSVVYVDGHGFCPGTELAFGNAEALVTSPIPQNSQNTSLLAIIPPLATTGKVYAIPPGGTIGSAGTAVSPQTYTVDNYRDTNGFSFVNSDQFQSNVGGYSFSDVSDVFGDAATHVDVNPCWPLGDCSIVTPIPDPFALLFWGIADASLQGGQCFGFSLASQRLLHGDEPYADFPLQSGQTLYDAWNLQGPESSGGPNGNLAHFIHLMHMEQLSAQALNFWWTHATYNAVFGSQSSLIGDVTSALNSNDHPLVEMRNGGDGHVVVAYNVEDGNNGDEIIDVYDPNQPYNTGEAETSGEAHSGVLSTSQIVVHRDGHWEFDGFSPSWTGGPGSLVIMPYGVVPVQPTLPTTLSGLVDLILGSAQVSQLTDSSGHTMFTPTGAVNTDPKTDIPNATLFSPLSGKTTSTATKSEFVVTKKADISSQKIFADSTGTYKNVLFGNGMAAAITSTTKGGTTDRVALDPGWSTCTGGACPASVQFGQVGGSKAAAGATSVQLLVHASDGTERTATLSTTMPKGAMDGISFDSAHDGVTVQAGAPPTPPSLPYPNTAVTLSLSWTGTDGYPQTFVAPKVTLSPGSSASLTPTNWSKLQSAAAMLTITQKNGKSTTRKVHNTVRPANSVAPSLAVSGKKLAKTLTIRAKVKRLAKGSSATLVWQVFAGPSLVGSHTEALPAARVRQGGTLKGSYVFPGAKGKRYRFRALITVLSPTKTGSVLSQTVSKVTGFTG